MVFGEASSMKCPFRMEALDTVPGMGYGGSSISP